MNSNKTFLWIAASLLTGAFCAASALAQPMNPGESYQRLSAVDEMNQPQAPALAGGFYGLSGNERRYQEPLQLSGASAKIQRAKYAKAKPKHHAKLKKISGKAKRPLGPKHKKLPAAKS